MGKLLLTGMDGNLGKQAAEYLLELVDKDRIIFCAYDPASLEPYKELGVETHVTNFNRRDARKLTGQEPLTVKYMFEHADEFQVGERHSQDH